MRRIDWRSALLRPQFVALAAVLLINWLLFPGKVDVLAPHESWGASGGARGNSPGDSPGAKTAGAIAWMLLAIPLLAPLGEPWGAWDHWPSWAVYAARPAVTKVFVHEDDLELIPADLRSDLQPPAPLEPWHRFRLDRWSLDAAKVPISPQDRFQVGAALALAEQCQLTTLRLTIDSPPDRWTGRRNHREFIGITAVQELAATYRLNALPR